MEKYKVTVDTDRHFKIFAFNDFNNAVKHAVKVKETAFRNGKHWTISFFIDDNLEAQITT